MKKVFVMMLMLTAVFSADFFCNVWGVCYVLKQQSATHGKVDECTNSGADC